MLLSRTLHRIVNLAVVFSLLSTIYPTPLWANHLNAAHAAPMSFDDGAVAADFGRNPTQPAATTQPIAIARVQSSYSSNSTVVISYTVTNNLPPTFAPPIDPSVNVTDSVDILSSLTITNDVNTLRNATVAVTLTMGTLEDAGAGTQSGSTITWQLGDLAPAESRVVTLSLTTPAVAAGFVDLDSGAVVSAELWQSPVSSTARPSNVVPDGIDPAYLRGTVDADVHDADMLWISAEFQQDPTALFSYVRSLDFDPYSGSLRGTRGTLWGQAGNAVDQSSTLIAMLRAAGIPARYRHGMLSTIDAQTLTSSMFDAPLGVAGILPAGSNLANPLNDANLLAEVQDHWWVEAYLPGVGWTDLDPSFANATAGDSFATPTTNDRIAELPADIRHTISLVLRREAYQAFPSNGRFLQASQPLEATFPTAQVASRPFILGHLVDSHSQAGLIFANVIHTYTPYFHIEGTDEYVLGETFDDLMTSFPLASHFTTGEWLTFTITDPDGNSETFEREVKDLLGLQTRLLGGSPDLTPGFDNPAFVSTADLFVTWYLPNVVDNEKLYSRYRDSLVTQIQPLATHINTLETAGTLNITPAETLQVQDAQVAIQSGMGRIHSSSILDFAINSDKTLNRLEEMLRVKFYYEQPRVVIFSNQFDAATDTVIQALDLRSTVAETIVYPNQAMEAEFTANWLKGVAESYEEGDAIERTSGVAPVTTARIFDAMIAQGIDPIFVTPDTMSLLDYYQLDASSTAHAIAALLEGKHLLIPTEPVMLDGEPILGWWEIEPQTGHTVSVAENGLHPSALEWTFISIGFGLPFTLDAAAGPAVTAKKIWDYVVCHVVPALEGGGGSGDCELGNPFGLPWPFGCSVCRSAERAPHVAPSEWLDLPDHLCPVDNCGVERFVLGADRATPIPLPDIIFGYRDQFEHNRQAQREVAVVDNGSGGADALTITPVAGGTVEPYGTTTFDAALSANFSGDARLIVLPPAGWFVGFVDDDTVTTTTPPTTPPGDYSFILLAQAVENPLLMTMATHTVTVVAPTPLTMDVSAETNITIPMTDAAFADASNETNDGEAEIPESAYRIDLANTSDLTKTFTISVTGAPAGWIGLNGAEQTVTQVELVAGQRTALGFYLMPFPDALPAPGTSHVIDIVVDDGLGNGDSEQIVWTMPGQAHNYMTIAPETLYVGANDTVSFTVGMTNTGNVVGAFAVNSSTPITNLTISPIGDFTLGVGASDSQIATLTTTGGEIGRKYPLQLSSAAPGSYTQYAFADVVIVSPDTEALFGAATEIATCSADPVLAAYFEAVGNTMSVLEGACNGGNCNSAQRDDVVNSVNALAAYISRELSGIDSTAATDAAAILGVADTVQANLDALPAIGDAVSALVEPVCQVAQSLPELHWSPTFDAARVGETVTYTLDLTNRGTASSSYWLTMTLPNGLVAVNPTIDAGANITYQIPVSSSSTALIGVSASVTADAAPMSRDDASASLNVVENFIQLLSVNPSPSFVETGASSSEIRIDVRNFAGELVSGKAQVAAIGPSGAVVDSAEIPISLNNPLNTVALNTFDTSGWTVGVYSITVNLVDALDSPIDSGSGYGLLNVGVGINPIQQVIPELVAPGTVSVTTYITTELTDTGFAGRQVVAQSADWQPTGTRALPAGFNETLTADDGTLIERRGELIEASDEVEVIVAGRAFVEEEAVVEESAEIPYQPATTAARVPSSANAIMRSEENDGAITYTGAVGSVNSSTASGGSFMRMDTLGETATFTTTSTWVQIGFAVGNGSGIAEVYVDGVLTDTIDLYNHLTSHHAATYEFGMSATRVITIAATDTKSTFANFDRVNIDYIDTWDGTLLPDGTFEQDDARVHLGTGWSSFSNAVASGGAYSRTNASAVWFPFTGDSVGLQTLATTTGGSWRVSVDGEFVTVLDQYHSATITHTLALDGFGAGPHVLHLESYRGSREYIDSFMQPGAAPFYAGDTDTGIIRYEEDAAGILFNGLPYEKSDDSISGWTYYGSNVGSEAHHVRSTRVGDVARFDFDGDWVGVGFVGSNNSGIAEIFVDGQSQGRVDLYRWDAEVVSRYFDGFGAGSHTITVTVTGDRHPFANNHRVNLDFFDTWDGTAELTGTVEAELSSVDRPILSGVWSQRSNGGFVHLTHSNDGNIWFPFTGDSVSFDAIRYSTAGEIEVYIDGQFITYLDLYSPTNLQQTYAFTTTTSGPHMLQLSQRRNNISVESFASPASAPYVDLTPSAGLVRYEESHPALRYNGVPLTATETTFIDSGWNEASSGYSIRTETLSDTISLDFYGSWVALGLLTWSGGGLGEVFLDGVSQGVVDFYSAENDNLLLIYDALTLDHHTIELVALADMNPLASNDRIYLDFIDVWDGSEEPDGWTEFTRVDANENISGSRNWNTASLDLAREGDYWFDGSNAWFRFTGESVSVRLISDTNVDAGVEIFIDGVSQGIESTYYRLSRTPLIFTYDGLTDGPHVVRVDNVKIGVQSRVDLDAFEADPTTPEAGYPMVEWEEIPNTGPLLNTSAAGDIDEDGVVEIVATDSGGNLIIYRGDGADATNAQAIAGTPIEFKIDLGSEPDSVALADLDGVAGSEIAVGNPQGFFVYTFDGTNWVQQWFTDTVRSTWRAPSIGNIDADPEPEIVTTGSNCICILEADGSALFEINRPYPTNNVSFGNPLPPNLADLNGDGRLDIVTGDYDDIFVFTTTHGIPELWWTQSYTDSVDGRGTPAIADLDGHLPGGDDAPEIAFVSAQHIYVVQAENGDVLWRFPTGGGEPGGVSIADLTGDGYPNVVATAKVPDTVGSADGQVWVLDAEGNLVWTKPALDSTSANSGSVLDLDGDGVWEVVWNGATGGLTVWRGSDGAVLYNEPLINSTTRMDFPIIVDVDGDDSAEIITGDDEGLFVVGFDNVWADSRPLWNQYNYHITNINDDLSVPLAELDSWDIHNTYRTQTPLENVLPVYDVTVTHTVPAVGVAVQSATAAVPFAVDGNPYGWRYSQAYYQPTLGNSFDVVLADMQAGEVRQISTETVVEYTLPSGSNRLTLPPMYVTAANIVALSPVSQTVGAGVTATLKMTLTNPSDAASIYTPTIRGIPSDWISGLPASVSVPAQSDLCIVLNIHIPDDEMGERVFSVAVETDNGGEDVATAAWNIIDAIDLRLAPAEQEATAGERKAYLLTVTNHSAEQQTIQLSASGLPSVTLPASVVVGANMSATVNIEAHAFVAGRLPFAVVGINQNGASDRADAILDVATSQGVLLSIAPDPAQGGPGMPSLVTVTVINMGDAITTFDLSVDVLAGWQAELGQSSVTLGAGVYNSAEIELRLTPPAGTAPNDYPFTVHANAQDISTSRTAAQPATASATGTLQVGNRGVQVGIDPASRIALPSDSATVWNVTITNTGSVQDTFVLSTTGIVALSGAFSQDVLTLDAGVAATVQLTATDLSFALPTTYTFAVAAYAQTDATIANDAQATLTFPNEEDVVVSWYPPQQFVHLYQEVLYLVTITNTGNVATVYDLNVDGSQYSRSTAISLTTPIERILIPAGATVQLPVRTVGPAPGLYLLNGQASSDGGTMDSAMAELIVGDTTAVGAISAETSHVPNWFTPFALLAVFILLTRAVVWLKRR